MASKSQQSGFIQIYPSFCGHHGCCPQNIWALTSNRIWFRACLSYIDHVTCFGQWNVGIRASSYFMSQCIVIECPTVCLSATVTTTSVGAASSSWVLREDPADENPQIAHDRHATRNKLRERNLVVLSHRGLRVVQYYSTTGLT